jgi:hypothetical protein
VQGEQAAVEGNSNKSQSVGWLAAWLVEWSAGWLFEKVVFRGAGGGKSQPLGERLRLHHHRQVSLGSGKGPVRG